VSGFCQCLPIIQSDKGSERPAKRVLAGCVGKITLE
jgi:hypothetical protein